MTLYRFMAAAALPFLIVSCGVFPGQAASIDRSPAIAQNPPQPDAPPGQQGQHRPPKIDFAAAAAKLGVSEAQLKQALGVPNSPNGQKRRPDLKAAAAKLGVSEAQLVQALGIPPRPPRPDFAAAASKLGVSEAQLKAALGVPAKPPSSDDRSQRPPRPDFKAAAAKLGVTEQQLVDALGVPPHPPSDERPANP